VKKTQPNPQKIAMWQKWSERIGQDVIHLLGHRKIYKSYAELLDLNPDVVKNGGLFHQWINETYITSVAMGIRRQLDTDKDVISLLKLIRDIKNNPNDLTRDWHISLYKSNLDDDIKNAIANETFTKHAGAGNIIDIKILEEDEKKLLQLADKITLYADRAIAHRSKSAIPQVTYGEVEQCIDALRDIAQRYILIFTAGYNLMEPEIIDYWESIFSMPWKLNR
jgi:hypothetical protein